MPTAKVLSEQCPISNLRRPKLLGKNRQHEHRITQLTAKSRRRHATSTLLNQPVAAPCKHAFGTRDGTPTKKAPPSQRFVLI